jgi:MGT family glycosyltransferase
VRERWEPTPEGTFSQPELAELLRFDNAVVASFYVPMGSAVATAVGDALAAARYDTVLLDMGAIAAAAACEASGVPYVFLDTTIPLMRWWPGRPCPGTGRGLADDPSVDAELAAAMDALLDATWLDCANEARSSFGLEPIAHITEVEERAARVLALTSAAFDHGAAAAPANYRYVGSCVPIGDGDGHEGLVDRDDGRPLVVMSPTTTSLAAGQVPFVRASIEALASLPVRGVVTVGRSLDPDDFEAAANVAVAGHVAHGALLPHASAMITHCGHGTVMTALHHGVPIVGLPDFADQADIAARVVDRGAGLRLGKPPDPGAIRDAVEEVVADPSYAAAAQAIAAQMAVEDGPSAAAAELELVAAGA